MNLYYNIISDRKILSIETSVSQNVKPMMYSSRMNNTLSGEISSRDWWISFSDYKVRHSVAGLNVRVKRKLIRSLTFKKKGIRSTCVSVSRNKETSTF